MPNELAPRVPKGDLLDRLEYLALRPEIDVGKLQALLDVQERVLGQRKEIAFTEAFSALAAELPRVRKSGHANVVTKSGAKMAYSYAKWDDMDAALRPLLIKHGFSLAFATACGPRPGTVVVRGVLTHREGASRTGEMELPFDASGGKNPVQGVGSALSYGRRYVAVMLLNIVVEEDDDDAGSIDAKGKSKRNFDRPVSETYAQAQAEKFAERATPTREMLSPEEKAAAPFRIVGPHGESRVETVAQWLADWQDILSEAREVTGERLDIRARWLAEKNLSIIDEIEREFPEAADTVRRGIEALYSQDVAAK